MIAIVAKRIAVEGGIDEKDGLVDIE